MYALYREHAEMHGVCAGVAKRVCLENNSDLYCTNIQSKHMAVQGVRNIGTHMHNIHT